MTPARRAFTFLEAVFAIALLATVVMTVVGGYGALRDLTVRDQTRLDATEVAHRLILIYTHMGPTQLPGKNEAIEQGSRLYRYSLSEDILIEDKNAREGLSVRRARPASTLSANERLGAGLVQITINVYPFEQPASGPPLASLSRIFDPYDTSNPDDVFIDHVMQLFGRAGVEQAAPK